MRGIVKGILASAVILGSFLLADNASALPTTGDGSTSNPYRIATCEDLQSISEDLTAHYVLTGDVDCSATESWNDELGFEPIGGLDEASPFVGVLDGQGYAITDLVINRRSEHRMTTGLFGAIMGGTVKNLDISGAVGGNVFTGGITGILYYGGSIVNVSSSQIIWGELSTADPMSGLPFSGVGGLAGTAMGSGALIDRSSTSGPIGADVGDSEFVVAAGGLAGIMFDGALARNSYSTSDVYALSSGTIAIGGAVGAFTVLGEDMPPIMQNVYASGTLHTLDVTFAGGLIAAAQGYISDSFSVAQFNIGGEPTAIGAFAGDGYDGDGFMNNYFDAGLAEMDGCTYLGPTSGCTAINTAGAPDASYFFDATNQPLANWDFTDIWIENDGAYPTLNRALVEDDPTEEPTEPDTDVPPLPTSSGAPLIFTPSITGDDTQTSTGSDQDEDNGGPATPPVPSDSTKQQTDDPQGPDVFFWIYAGVAGTVVVGAIALAIRFGRR